MFVTWQRKTTLEDLIRRILFIVILRTTPPPSDFFSFSLHKPSCLISFLFLYKFMLVSFIIMLDFWSCKPHFVFCLTLKETVGLTLPAVGGQKRAAPPFNHGKITYIIIRISIRIIYFPNLFELIVTWNGILD
jgi:hypothetical protein